MPGNLISDALLQQIHAVIKSWMQRNVAAYIPRVPQVSHQEIVHLAKSTSSISKGSTGDMTIYRRNTSGTPVITSPAETLSDVWAEMGAYTADKLAYVKMVGGKWVIIMTECAS